MSKKETILRLIDLIEQAELELANSLSETERQTPGNLEKWAPKEVLCHTVDWTDRILENIDRAHNGEAITEYENYLEINDQDFLTNCKYTWEQSWERSVASRRRLRELLAGLSEEDLDRTDLPPSKYPRPLWQRIIGNSVEHAIFHLDGSMRELGKHEISTRIQEAISAELIELAPDDSKWKGTVLYNRACFHALAGQKQKAVSELKESLVLNPELTDWSKEDTDLVNLHDDPEYQAIYSAI